MLNAAGVHPINKLYHNCTLLPFINRAFHGGQCALPAVSSQTANFGKHTLTQAAAVGSLS